MQNIWASFSSRHIKFLWLLFERLCCAPLFIFVSALAHYPFTNKLIIRWILEFLYFGFLKILFWVNLEIWINTSDKYKQLSGSQSKNKHSSVSREQYFTHSSMLFQKSIEQPSCIEMSIFLLFHSMFEK